jgi:hypothetical protein
MNRYSMTLSLRSWLMSAASRPISRSGSDRLRRGDTGELAWHAYR